MAKNIDISILGALAVFCMGMSSCTDNESKQADVYTQTNDTVYVTGTTKNQNPLVTGIDKNNKEVRLFFVKGSAEENSFIDRQDTIVVNRKYKNGKVMLNEDSLIVNLTRQKLINDIKSRNLQK